MIVDSPLDEGVANIPSNYSRIIGRELALQLRDLPKLLKFTQLSVEQFMQDDTLLTAKQQVQILDNGLQLSPHEDFGLRLGRRLTPATHGAMGFLANSSPNLLMALKAFQSFVPTRMSFVRISLKTSPTWVECTLNFDIALSAEVHRALSETAMVIFFECAEFIIGRPLTESSIYFTHEEPCYSAIYPNYLTGDYTFSAPHFTIKIPMDVCHIANVSANQDSYLLAMQQCESMLAQLKSQHHYSNGYQVEKMMLSHPLGAFSEEDAAAALFISKRTLARRLEKEGHRYQQIRDKVLSQQASHYLQHGQMSVEAISALLNYSDSANFRRAFKRWFKVSPSEYRQGLKLSDHDNTHRY